MLCDYVIMSEILITTLFYKALILQREIWCWSLLGLQGLNEVQTRLVFLSLGTILSKKETVNNL